MQVPKIEPTGILGVRVRLEDSDGEADYGVITGWSVKEDDFSIWLSIDWEEDSDGPSIVSLSQVSACT